MQLQWREWSGIHRAILGQVIENPRTQLYSKVKKPIEATDGELGV